MSVLRKCLIICLAGLIALSVYNVVRVGQKYSAENVVHAEEMRFKPDAAEGPATGDGLIGSGAGAGSAFVNQSIVELQERYPDAVGWITVPYTGIDYPFAQARDNSVYLSEGMDGSYAAAGTPFMDCVNSGDFSDFNTIIYGHHMKNGTMFGSLKEFGDKEFFDANRSGSIFLADKTYGLEFFAYMVVPMEDDVVFGIPCDESSKIVYIDHVKNRARHYRETGLGTNDRIVTLSTCAYEFDNARMVLLGKISEMENIRD